jgi:hypothetical protein
MSDMKWETFEIALDIAQDEYGKDFYELSQDERDEVYGRAAEAWMEGRISQAEQS